jgi:hypothetical protein
LDEDTHSYSTSFQNQLSTDYSPDSSPHNHILTRIQTTMAVEVMGWSLLNYSNAIFIVLAAKATASNSQGSCVLFA